MIRRWSRINFINNNINNIYLICKIENFKTSVNFKKFFFKITKFKRKNLIRWKHKTNFINFIYIFKKWTLDYLFFKNIIKFQFFNNIFFFCVIANTTLNLINKQLPTLNNINHFNIFHLTKKNLIYFYNKSFNFNYTNLNWNFIFSTSLNNIKTNNKIIGLTEFYEKYSYDIKLTEIDNTSFFFNKIYSIFFDINLLKMIELYKIFNLFFYKQILKR